MSSVRELPEIPFRFPDGRRLWSPLLEAILVVRALWCALASWRTLSVLLWTIRLRNEKAARVVSGLPGLDEADACDVHRSLSSDISMALPTVDASERSCEGRPFLFDSMARNRLSNRYWGGPSYLSRAEMICAIPDSSLLWLLGTRGGRCFLLPRASPCTELKATPVGT